jgi:invasion protein IalB
MNSRFLSASALPRGRVIAGLVVAAAFALPAIAQTPPAKEPAKKETPKAAPKTPAKKDAAPPAQQPAQQQPQGQPQQAQQDQIPQLIYSPWTKFCLKGQDASAKQVCFTGKDGRLESGQPVVAAVIIEPEGEPKKVLRVTLPLGMQLQYGTRIVIDSNAPQQQPFVICFQNGCMSDYEATADALANLKKGQTLYIQAFNANGVPFTLTLPLAEFGKAYDGPPTDPKVFEEQQKKLQEELQKRANEAREKLEQQQKQNAPASK